MKKLFAAVLALALLTGCSSKPPMENGGAVSSAPTAPSAVSSAPSAESTASSAESTAPSAELSAPSEPAADWLSSSGLQVTPQGSHTIPLQSVESLGDAQGVDFDANFTVSITETREGVGPNEKMVTCLFTFDFSNNPLSIVNHWTSAFDRYSGTSFEFSSGVTATGRGETNTRSGYAQIPLDDGSYADVSIEFTTNSDYPIVEKTISVICPADYDGTVFQIGYDCAEKAEATAGVMAEEKLHRVDEMPYVGDGYMYFSATDR